MFVNDTLLFAIISKEEHVDYEKILDIIREDEKNPEEFKKKLNIKKGLQVSRGKEKLQLRVFVGCWSVLKFYAAILPFL